MNVSLAPDQREISFFVYHYTTAKKAISILESGYFRPARLSECADPYESKAWNFGVKRNIRNGPIPSNIDELGRTATAKLREDWHVLCLTSDMPGQDFRNTIGGCIPAMWTHYGDKHSGACLILRWPNLYESVLQASHGQMLIFGWVNYGGLSDLPPQGAFTLDYDEIESNGMDRALLHHTERFYKELFLTKHASWSCEQEYRYLVRSSRPVDVPIRDAVRGIYVGSDIAREDAEVLRGFGEELSVEVRVMTWVNCNPLARFCALYQPPGMNRLWTGA